MKRDGQQYPPRYAERFLRWFCPAELLESVEGDLLEQFESDVVHAGEKVARRQYLFNTIRFFRAGILLRNRFSLPLTDIIMFRNYLTIAGRNVLKNKVFSAINVFGLATGLAACLMIFQFVVYELSYDSFHDKFERIYRVTNDRFQNGKLIQHGTIMYPTIGPTMAKDYPEIELYTRLMPVGELYLKVGDKTFKGDECHFADEFFFSVFSFPMLAGNRTTALKEPFSMVITESTAKKYFGKPDEGYTAVIDKVVYWGRDPQPFRITGVCADVPENSHIDFDALVSYTTLIRPDDRDADISWTWSDMRHYLVLRPGVDYKALEAKFPGFSDRYFKGDKVSGSIEKFYLQPLKDAHLYSDYEYDIARTASGKAVWAMLIVAGFILVIAWINYINLTTSRAMERAKEVGLRKVMGAVKSQLVRQFIFESVLISGVAFVAAIVIVQIAQSVFNSIVESNLSWWKVMSELEPGVLFLVGAVLAAGILLASFYPAFVLSSYQPVTVLKGKFQRSSRGQMLRKGLVIVQFTASVALITGTLIVSRQLSYMNEADLGIGIDNRLVVDPPELLAFDSTTIQRIENYKDALLQIKGVARVTTSNNTPGARLGRTFDLRLSDQSSDAKYTMSYMNVDYDFFDTYDVGLEAGRKFVASDHKFNFQDIKAIILNVSATKLLGIADPAGAIGKEIVWGNNGTRLWTIVGVVNDYHQESLRNPREAMVFRPAYSTYHPTTIKLEKGYDAQKLVPQIAGVYKKFFPDDAFEYSFLESSYKAQYRDDNRFGKVIRIFTALAIIISCLGLIGLSSYTALQRTKEIGIRKVLGASLPGIVSLLSADFIRLIMIAAVLALPIAWIAMDNWLESYAYRITVGWMFYVLPVVIILFVAVVTMSFHVLKTARTNPAETLKYE